MADFNHWMEFHVGDYIADTGHLSVAQHGAYLLLIFHQWRTRRAIPNDDRVLAQVTRQSVADWTEMRPVIELFFDVTKRGWSQSRVEKDLEATEIRYKKAVEDGRKGANKRKALGGYPNRHTNRDTTGAPSRVATGTPIATRTTKVLVEGDSAPSESAGEPATLGLDGQLAGRPATGNGHDRPPPKPPVSVDVLAHSKPPAHRMGKPPLAGIVKLRDAPPDGERKGSAPPDQWRGWLKSWAQRNFWHAEAYGCEPPPSREFFQHCPPEIAAEFGLKPQG